jgi:hypothetical protein
MENWTYPWVGSRTDLIARPRELEALAVSHLFLRFGLELSLETLTRVQASIGR